MTVLTAPTAALGIAGVNTRPLQGAALGIAGNWGSTLRRQLAQMTAPAPSNRSNLGDRASRECWRKAVTLLDYTYLACPAPEGGMRPRPGFVAMTDRRSRRFPLFLDSAAFREFKGTAPGWSSYEAYCETIDLLRPDGAMAKDVVGDQAASRRGYERMCADGYRDLTVPVWQAREALRWSGHPRGDRAAYLRDAAGQAVHNGRLAAADPELRRYVEQAPLVAIGGLAQSPCPAEVRSLYLAELCGAFPEARFWALAQASAPVVNGLGRLGLLDRVSTDGSWWIHHARCEQLAVVEDGLLRSIKLTHTGAQSFFTLPELMAANLRSLLSAYAGLWTFPGPPAVPTAMEDADARLELRRRLGLAQLDLFEQLGL